MKAYQRRKILDAKLRLDDARIGAVHKSRMLDVQAYSPAGSLLGFSAEKKRAMTDFARKAKERGLEKEAGNDSRLEGMILKLAEAVRLEKKRREFQESEPRKVFNISKQVRLDKKIVEELRKLEELEQSGSIDKKEELEALRLKSNLYRLRSENLKELVEVFLENVENAH